MEFVGRKRKGGEIIESSRKNTISLTVLWSRLSLDEYSTRRKKCKEVEVIESRKSVVKGVATAPVCGVSSLDPPGRGLKRKIGCIDIATRMGRKKKIELDYVLGEVIGKGKFGSVVRCWSKSCGEEVACKTVRKGKEIVHREVEIMQHLSGHPDFGLAVRISNGQNLFGVVGSPAYVAPEVLEGNYSTKVDIWSAGVLLHALLIGLLPFHGSSVESVFEAVKNVNLDFKGDKWESISQPARDLLAHMLTRNVSSRFTADDVLSHPWIRFYTEPTVNTLTLSPVLIYNSRLTTKQPTPRADQAITRSNTGDDQGPVSSTRNSGKRPADKSNDLVDVLAEAISRVRISEPKRSRLCSPANPIEQECSSNIKVNSLCAAF
ncbi:Protein kinase domain-containing protein [Heracleum sosnowskyi]|uniref:Protein kinase domain-containing protein n=1 Tax=Heracleum sosnowskyi TaxID=360622 RepID=A0AAD8M4P5_9APIA|nr:Protein kinase domain-containing protein [Heracleum sosnowskyi]